MADPPVSIDDFALATVAARPDEAGEPPPQVLRATGQPPCPDQRRPTVPQGHSLTRLNHAPSQVVSGQFRGLLPPVTPEVAGSSPVAPVSASALQMGNFC